MDAVYLFGRARCGGLEPACVRGASPMLIYRACQLVGLLINTWRARRCDEIFVASGIEHVEVALTRPSSGEGELESYAAQTRVR